MIFKFGPVYRGINVTGSAKLPLAEQPTTRTRPAPLSLPSSNQLPFGELPFDRSEQRRHAERLASLGFNLIRLVLPWEVLAPYSPDLSPPKDQIDSILHFLRECKRVRVRVIVDGHQDVASRFTGGDGFPAWAVEACNVTCNAEVLHRSLAAHLHSMNSDESYPRMSWSCNHGRLGCATLMTMFWGGGRFLGKWDLQQKLQSNYIRVYAHLASAISAAGLADVIAGFDAFNEPDAGFIGIEDLSALARSSLDPIKGMTPRAAIQSGAAVWLDGECPFKGIKDDHFKLFEGESFEQTFLAPFLVEFQRRVVDAHLPNSRLFVEGRPFRPLPSLPFASVPCPHWYDLETLIYRKFNKRQLPLEKLKSRMLKQIKGIMDGCRTKNHPERVVLGEFGLAMNLDVPSEKLESERIKALRFYYDILDDLGIGGCLWNYTPSNCDDDRWNREDLSIISRGRFRAGLCYARPYVEKWESRDAAEKQVRWRYHDGMLRVAFSPFVTTVTVVCPGKCVAVDYTRGVNVRIEQDQWSATFDAFKPPYRARITRKKGGKDGFVSLRIAAHPAAAATAPSSNGRL